MNRNTECWPKNALIMSSKRSLSLLIAFLVSFSYVPQALSCTIFTVQYNGVVYLAGNEDYEFAGFGMSVDKSGSLGVVYIESYTADSPTRMVKVKGVNEKGLSYDTSWIPEEKLSKGEEARVAPQEWIVTKLMKETGSVEELLTKIFLYDWGESIFYQVHFADRSGDAVVIHPDENGNLTYTRKKTGNGYLISTNFNLNKMSNTGVLSTLTRFFRIGWFGWNRYAITDEMLSDLELKKNISIESISSVVEATRGSITEYSSLFDLTNQKIYVYHKSRYQDPIVINVAEELAKTDVKRKIPLEQLIPTIPSTASAYDPRLLKRG